jgi:hypothetical protein
VAAVVAVEVAVAAAPVLGRTCGAAFTGGSQALPIPSMKA